MLGEDGLPGNPGEFKYKLDQEYPDLYVKRGGWIKAVNEDHLPILKLVGMSAVKVGLEKVSCIIMMHFSGFFCTWSSGLNVASVDSVECSGGPCDARRCSPGDICHEWERQNRDFKQ